MQCDVEFTSETDGSSFADLRPEAGMKAVEGIGGERGWCSSPQPADDPQPADARVCLPKGKTPKAGPEYPMTDDCRSHPPVPVDRKDRPTRNSEEIHRWHHARCCHWCTTARAPKTQGQRRLIVEGWTASVTPITLDQDPVPIDRKGRPIKYQGECHR